MIGGGVMKRPTNDPTKTRLTGGFMAGLEANLWQPSFERADLTAGGRLILLPSASHHQLYIIALTIGLRFG